MFSVIDILHTCCWVALVAAGAWVAVMRAWPARWLQPGARFDSPYQLALLQRGGRAPAEVAAIGLLYAGRAIIDSDGFLCRAGDDDPRAASSPEPRQLDSVERALLAALPEDDPDPEPSRAALAHTVADLVLSDLPALKLAYLDELQRRAQATRLALPRWLPGAVGAVIVIGAVVVGRTTPGLVRPLFYLLAGALAYQAFKLRPLTLAGRAAAHAARQARREDWDRAPLADLEPEAQRWAVASRAPHGRRGVGTRGASS